MIFYTLQGPRYRLEIHDDKMKLYRKGWWNFLATKQPEASWEINALSRFEITVPQLILGKLEWQTFDGTKGSFHFSTNATMVKKIEKYLQKRIVKNHTHNKVLVLPLEKSSPESIRKAA